ncbi:PTS sugar transporter subunit IIB [Thermovorax subterraneus]|nr:PTS sugar transporter subunit IIB [Thermovorax subterraneus]
MKRILLVCGAGMSTSLLVTKMQKAAKERGIEVEIAATSGESIDKEIENVDVLLLGPQIRYKEDEFKKKYGDKFPIEVIDPMDYGMMNGEKVLDFALKLIGEK